MTRAPRSSRRRTDFAQLPTEAAHPLGDRVHVLETRALVAALLDEEARAAAAVATVGEAIARAAELVASSLRAGGRVVYVGAGTSGRIGALDAAELPPTFGLDPSRAVAVVAGGPAALGRAVEGAEDRPAPVRRALGRLRVGRDDVVVAVAASGVTPFTRAALDEAHRLGARRVFVTCSALAADAPADVVVVLAVGPEVIAGSTRMKSATATKVALNAMSTAAMVRLGKVWRGRMVDVVAGNAKLRDRARRMLVELGGVDARRAAALLARARGHVKTALVAARRGVTVREAARLLDEADGDLSRILD